MEMTTMTNAVSRLSRVRVVHPWPADFPVTSVAGRLLQGTAVPGADLGLQAAVRPLLPTAPVTGTVATGTVATDQGIATYLTSIPATFAVTDVAFPPDGRPPV